MTQQFENFVNAALDKSLASDVTLPTADEIPVFTGIGRQVTGKTKAELGLATSSQLTGKADLVDGLVPASQLPGYVDDVLEYADLASFPLLGEASKLYIAIDTKLVYRWGGSTYAVTSPSLALGETSTTAYYGDNGKKAYDHSQATGNPHNLPAASTNTDGYLTRSDWNTFNGKQAALGDVVTENTYGSSTQYPIVTVNAKGIVTGITLQTVPTPTFTDATFAVQKNGSPSISATWSLTAFTASHVHTYPDKDINLGTMSSVATTDGNNLSGTRTRIVGGRYNNVSGTDSVAIAAESVTLAGTRNTAIACSDVGIGADYDDNILIGFRAIGGATLNTDAVTYIGTGAGAYIAGSDNFPYGSFVYTSQPAIVVRARVYAGGIASGVNTTLYATSNGTGNAEVLAKLLGATYGSINLHEITLVFRAYALFTCRAVYKRQVITGGSTGGILDVRTIDTDIVIDGTAYTVSFTVNDKKLRIQVGHEAGPGPSVSCIAYVKSTYHA